MVTLNKMKEDLRKSTEQRDNKGVMSVLSDPNISIEDKKIAIENVKKSQFLKDDATTLLSNAFEQESQGETVENEDARLSSLGLLIEMHDARARQQGLVNAHGAGLDDANVETFFDMLGLYVSPFGNSYSTAKIAAADAKARGDSVAWAFVKAFTLPGSQTMEWREQMESATPEQLEQMTSSFIELLKNNSGLIVSNDNQFAEFDKANSVFSEGGYGTFEQVLDNISPLLDLIGLRTLRLGGKLGAVISKVSKASKATDVPFTEIAQAAVARAPSKTPTSAVARVTEADLAKSPVPSKAIPEPASEQLAKMEFRRSELAAKVETAKTPEAAKKIQDRVAKLDSQIAEMQAKQPTFDIVKSPIADLIERIDYNRAVRIENPASPANIIQQANPQKARDFHEAVFKSQSDEIAQGLYDPVNKKVRWLYKTGTMFTNTSETYELVFDTLLGAFVPYKISNPPDYNVEVVSIFQATPFILETVQDDVVVEGDPVLSATVEVTTSVDVRNSGSNVIKYLVMVKDGASLSYTFSLLHNTSFLDWEAYNDVGVDAPAYLVTGDQIVTDSSIHKQVPYLTIHFRRTENGVDEDLVPVNQSSCKVRSQWDFANSVNSNKWGRLFQAYRYRRAYLAVDEDDTYDTGHDVITSKNKLRGRGKAFALHMETEPGKDCQILGWNLAINGNATT